MISSIIIGVLYGITIVEIAIISLVGYIIEGLVSSLKWIGSRKARSIRLLIAAILIIGMVGFVTRAVNFNQLPMVTIESSANDVIHSYTAGESHGLVTDTPYLVVGVGPTAVRYDAALRFESINIPPHAQITSAYLMTYTCTASPGEQEIPTYLTIKLENSDNAIPIETDEGWHSRPLTSGTSWIANIDWETYQWYGSNSFYADLQTVVSRPGWEYGNDINVFVMASNPFYNFHYKTLCAYDWGGETYSARLYVSFLTSIATPTPTPTTGPTPVGGPEKIGVFEGWPKSSVLIVVIAGFIVLAVGMAHFHVPPFAILVIEAVAAAGLFSSQFAATWIVLVGVLTLGIVVILVLVLRSRGSSDE